MRSRRARRSSNQQRGSLARNAKLRKAEQPWPVKTGSDRRRHVKKFWVNVNPRGLFLQKEGVIINIERAICSKVIKISINWPLTRVGEFAAECE